MSLPGATEPLAAELVSDGVDISYVQQSGSPFLNPVWTILPVLLFLVVPAGFVVVVVVLVVGVLWRLYRPLGRPGGIM